jgi:hypothetical protein
MNERDRQSEMQAEFRSGTEMSFDTDLGSQGTERSAGEDKNGGSGLTGKWAAVAVALVLAVGAVGYALTPSPTPPVPVPDVPGTKTPALIPTDVGVEIIRDIAGMKQAIEAMPLLDPELKKNWLAGAERQTIQIVRFYINKTALDGQESALIRTDMASHQYTVGPNPQIFSLPSKRDSASFLFDALSSAPGATVSGVWTTPAGQQPYRLVPRGAGGLGDTSAASAMTVRLR